MKIIHTVRELKEQLTNVRYKCLVPTMGNLHEGHLRLIDEAHAKSQLHNGQTIATIFVNRLQFGPNEDFDRYPRTLDNDCALLDQHGCDVVFAPDESELYPEAQTYTVSPPPDLADTLEGHFRPGFFTGVCTVVMKLFSLIQPQSAVFGKKDYQQLMIIEKMVKQFNLPIDIIGLDTLRAKDGLALSSRNGYLSTKERMKAVELYQSIQRLAQLIKIPGSNGAELCQKSIETLNREGWMVDYISLCNQSDLSPCTQDKGGNWVVLAAAKIGKTRLIDNIEINF
ncbi:MAG: pantoate--beta-alanine ligase [Betaproteobacteria bacterium]|jgi:pantoate--beta-alanine ligase